MASSNPHNALPSGYGIQPLGQDLVRIVLPNPGLPAPYRTPSNVYLLTGGGCTALVGTGHPRSLPALDAALAALGHDRGDIDRIVAMDWFPDQLGAVEHFPNAAVFALGPQASGPRHMHELVYAERRGLLAFGEYVLEHQLVADEADRSELDLVLERWWGEDLPREVDAIPIRAGHTLQLGERRFRVLELGGSGPGHMVLYQSRTLVLAGMLLARRPTVDPRVRDGARAGEGLDRLSTMDAPLLLSTVGPPERDMKWAASHATRSFVNMVQSLPILLKKPMTAAQVMGRNLGYRPRHVVRLAESSRTMAAYLDECARAGKVRAEGEGPGRVYHGHDMSDRLTRW